MVAGKKCAIGALFLGIQQKLQSQSLVLAQSSV